MSIFGFGPTANVDIVLSDADTRKTRDVPADGGPERGSLSTEKTKMVTLPIFERCSTVKEFTRTNLDLARYPSFLS